jgi:hypothetical protein
LAIKSAASALIALTLQPRHLDHELTLLAADVPLGGLSMLQCPVGS